jgi:lipoate-protein ligase A
LDDALLKAKSMGSIPSTLRFLQFSPSSVLVGYHQSVEQEVRMEFCKQNGIDINRRITGGGAIYFDEPQLGWEIIASKNHPKIPNNVEKLYEVLCEGAILGMKKLGVDAAFRPKNDIEVKGRKISGTGGALEGNVFLFQGTLLTDFDVGTMMRALRIPIEKLKDKDIDSVKERVTCLKWELGSVPSLDSIKSALMDGFSEIFDVSFEPGKLTSEEEQLVAEKLGYFTSDQWIHGIRRPLKSRRELRAAHKTPGGLIRISVVADSQSKRIHSALITGDFFAYPKRTIFDLEAALKDTSADPLHLKKKVHDFFEKNNPEIPGVEPEDFLTVIFKALEKLTYTQFGIPENEVNRVFTVNSTLNDIPRCTVLLLPYCSKLPECEYRHEKGCDKCGDCNVGDEFEFAEKHGLTVETIIDFEDLLETLTRHKENGIAAFIGSCCEAFYEKHMEDFEKIGLPGVLVDIDSETCYDLGREKEAKLGEFESKTDLKTDLLERVMRKVCL